MCPMKAAAAKVLSALSASIALHTVGKWIFLTHTHTYRAAAKDQIKQD